jgi:hypothetical protein
MQYTNLTTTGYTPILKLAELASSLTSRTLSPLVWDGAESAYIVQKTFADFAFDDLYSANFTVAVTGVTAEPADPDEGFFIPIYFQGSLTVEFLTSIDGGTTIVSQTSVTYYSNPDGTTATYTGQKLLGTIPAAPINTLFGLRVSAGPFYDGTLSTALSSTSVTFQSASAPAETSMTPTGASSVTAMIIIAE